MTSTRITIKNAAGKEITFSRPSYMRAAIIVFTACVSFTIQISEIELMPKINVVAAGNLFMHGIEKEEQEKLEKFLNDALKEASA